jgi:hypothetical protein
MSSVLESLARSGPGVEVSLFMIGRWSYFPNPRPADGVTKPSRVEHRELQSSDELMAGWHAYELELHFNYPPIELLRVATTLLLSAIEIGSTAAWLGYEGSFSFDHILTPDVARRIYGVGNSNGALHMSLDASVLNGPLWAALFDATRQHLDASKAEPDRRQLALLRVVAAGRDVLDARSIDLTMGCNHRPIAITVLKELQILREMGLAVVDSSDGVGGRWSITPSGADYLSKSGS